AKRDVLRERLFNYGQNFLGSNFDFRLVINNEDHLSFEERKKRQIRYLLVHGSSLDNGEVGVVGRGNSASGLISTMRWGGMEAPYGKNPLHHAGKVYTFIAHRLAQAIAETFDCHVSVAITSKVGNLLSDPGAVVVRLSKDTDKSIILAIVNAELSNGNWFKDIISTKFFVPTIGENILIDSARNFVKLDAQKSTARLDRTTLVDSVSG
ncbi:MAG: methionine adenosyltransferase, partial [Acidobacteriota bacterium]